MGIFGAGRLCCLYTLGVPEQKEWYAFGQIWNKGPGDYFVDAKVLRNLVAAKLFD